MSQKSEPTKWAVNTNALANGRAELHRLGVPDKHVKIVIESVHYDLLAAKLAQQEQAMGFLLEEVHHYKNMGDQWKQQAEKLAKMISRELGFMKPSIQSLLDKKEGEVLEMDVNKWSSITDLERVVAEFNKWKSK